MTIREKWGRIQIGGVWHVLVMVGHYRGWREWHHLKEDRWQQDLIEVQIARSKDMHFRPSKIENEPH